jgi:hypothetical protein
VLGQRLAGVLAEAVHQVPDARRQARLFGDLQQERAVTGENSAGLCTTVQPAASAGAIFQVDSMKGVFHGVITPTGPIGTRVVTFISVGEGSACPSRAPGRAVGEEAEVLGPAQGRLGHEADRLAGVPAFAQRDFLGAGDDGVGDAVQDLLAGRATT